MSGQWLHAQVTVHRSPDQLEEDGCKGQRACDFEISQGGVANLQTWKEQHGSDACVEE